MSLAAIRLLALVALGWLLLRLWAGSRGPRENKGDEGRGPSERMVRCARCDVYVPESSAVTRDGRSYCNAAHATEDAGEP